MTGEVGPAGALVACGFDQAGLPSGELLAHLSQQEKGRVGVGARGNGRLRRGRSSCSSGRGSLIVNARSVYAAPAPGPGSVDPALLRSRAITSLSNTQKSMLAGVDIGWWRGYGFSRSRDQQGPAGTNWRAAVHAVAVRRTVRWWGSVPVRASAADAFTEVLLTDFTAGYCALHLPSRCSAPPRASSAPSAKPA